MKFQGFFFFFAGQRKRRDWYFLERHQQRRRKSRKFYLNWRILPRRINQSNSQLLRNTMMHQMMQGRGWWGSPQELRWSFDKRREMPYVLPCKPRWRSALLDCVLLFCQCFPTIRKDSDVNDLYQELVYDRT